MQSDFFQQTAKVFTVGELTRAIRGTLETNFGAIWVQGEISNYKLHPSGHQYFTLKDQRAQIACVIFRNTLPPFRPPLTDGSQVQVFGSLTLFEARGQYQLNVQLLQARGAGLLQAKFEALKRKLEAEGLFDAARKRPLPKFPQRIGIVTSPSGAAIRDMLNVLQRRAPALQILIHPVRVQGSGAAAEIAVAIRELAQLTVAQLFKLQGMGSQVENLRYEGSAPALDLLVVTRGGGSIEDLWEFNEEIVARAMIDSSIPVVSAVGHEVDFTIADFVADLRAPTPSAAAELIVPEAAEVGRRLGELAACLDRSLRNFITQNQTRLRFLSEKTLGRELLNRARNAQQQIDLARDTLTRHVRRAAQEAAQVLLSRARGLQSHNPQRELVARRDRALALEQRFRALPERLLQQKRHRFEPVEAMLRVLGPEATLGRGYSITTTEAGEVIYSAQAIAAGALVRTRVADGTFQSKVVEK
ncbi:exodeoxyribonuclease VII large subunit [soil metagenome]